MHPPPPNSKQRDIAHLASRLAISLIVVWTQTDRRRPQDCFFMQQNKESLFFSRIDTQSCSPRPVTAHTAASNCTHPIRSTHTRLRSLINVFINTASHATSYDRLHNMHALLHGIYHRPFPSLCRFTSSMPNLFLDLSLCLADK